MVEEGFVRTRAPTQVCQAFSHAELMALKKIKLGKMPCLQHQNGASKCRKQSSEWLARLRMSTIKPKAADQFPADFSQADAWQMQGMYGFPQPRVILRRHRCSKTVGIWFKATSTAMYFSRVKKLGCKPFLPSEPRRKALQNASRDMALHRAYQCQPRTATDLKPEGTELTIFQQD